MTVRELKEKLKNLDDDMRVVIDDSDTGEEIDTDLIITSIINESGLDEKVIKIYQSNK